jgi:opacity protein-like surface antigen
MQKLLLIGAALGLMAASLPARADDEVPNTVSYLEADLGHASLDRSGISSGPAQSSGISGTTTTGTLLGGYFFTDNFGAELGYHDFGNSGAFTKTGVNGIACPTGDFSCPHVSGFSASLLGKIEVVPNLDGILRLGVLSWDVGSSGPIKLLDKTSGQAFLYGIGVRRRFDGGWGLVISYERSSFTTEETRIGLSYSF